LFTDLFEHLVNQAAEEVAKELCKATPGTDVVILVTPGSARHEAARRAAAKCNTPVKILTYKADEPGTEPLDKDAVDKILKEDAKAIVIPPDNLAARELYQRLTTKRRKVIDLPHIYQRLLGSSYNYAKVRYRVLSDIVNEAEGISISLLQLNSQDVKKGAEAIRRLDPRQSAKDLLAEVLRDLATKAGAQLVASLIHLGIELLEKSDTGSWLIDNVRKISSQLGIRSEDLLEKLLTKGRTRWQFVEAVVQFAKAAAEASPYLQDPSFEAVVAEVANDGWGLSVEEFKTLTENAAKLLHSKTATKDDIERLKKELEDRLDKAWEEIEKLRRRIEEAENDLKTSRIIEGVWTKPEDLGFDLERGVFHVYGTDKPLVVTESFERQAEKILEGIREGKFIVVRGEKGISKSTLTLYALAKALSTGNFRAYKIATTRKELAEKFHKLSLAVKVALQTPVLFYDPATPPYYEAPFDAPQPTAVGQVIQHLLDLYERLRKEGRHISVVVVLPNDIYAALPSEIKQRLDAHRTVEVNLRQPQFLSEIVKAYGGAKCNDEVYQKIGKAIAEKYNGGYTLVARYAGEWLRRTGCTDDVAEAVEAGGGNAKAFLALYIYKGIFQGDSQLLWALAIPFLARAKLGPMPPKWLEEIPQIDTRDNTLYCNTPLHSIQIQGGDEAREFIKKWLAEEHEDLIEEVIKELAQGTLSAQVVSVLKEKVALEHIRNIENTLAEVAERLKSPARVVGNCRGGDPVDVLFEQLTQRKELREAIERHPWDFLEAVGKSLLNVSVEVVYPKIKSQRGGLSEWIIVENNMPLSVVLFLQRSVSRFANIIDHCQAIEHLYQRAIEKGELLEPTPLAILALSESRLGQCIDKAWKLLATWIEAIAPTEEGLRWAKDFINHLLENGMFDEAAAIVARLSSHDQDLVKVIEPNKLSWIGKIYYGKALIDVQIYNVKELNYKYIIDKIKEIINYICNLQNDIKCYIAPLILVTKVPLPILKDPSNCTRLISLITNNLKHLSKYKYETIEKQLKHYINIECPLDNTEKALKKFFENVFSKLTLLTTNICPLDKNSYHKRIP